MTIPKGFDVTNSKKGEYVLQVHKNVYGQKQAGRVWNKFLVEKLINNLHFKQSKVDECVFYRGSTIYILYTDDSILAGPNQQEIDQIIIDLKEANLDITIEGDLQDFLGVNIERSSDGRIHLSQPHLIDQILHDLRLTDDSVKTKDTPAPSSKILLRHTESEDFDNSFHYRSVIGKLNYLEKCTRSDISYATHQCARFSSCSKKEHGKAVRHIGRYLKGNKTRGTIMSPNTEGLEMYVDADFAGNWDATEAASDRDTARSRHGYIITYAGCPIVWKSQLQNEVCLSCTESEYTGLSHALREAIPIMELLNEMKTYKFPVSDKTPRVKCKVFEDNSGAIEMANTHKYRPRTKHINCKLHHFRDYVTRKEIQILPIESKHQRADYLTKPVNIDILKRLRQKVMGW